MEPHDLNQPRSDDEQARTATSGLKIPRLLTRLRDRRNRLIVSFIVLSILLLLAVGLLVTKNNGPKPADKPPVATEQRNVEIEITSNGFIPAVVNVTKGTKVTWVNKDRKSHHVASNPHPEHTGTPGLDSRQPIGPDGTYSFTFDKPGTNNYHDHLSPTMNGTVVVVE